MRWLRIAVLLGIVFIGAWTRWPGFDHGDPWFDDAWVVLSSRQSFATAFHMVNTTPLFSLGMRSWILLKPGVLWWAQLPVFLLGIGTVVAVFLLLRYFQMWWPVPYLGALVIAVSPIAVEYSTRVKQYNLDILLSCAVLWLFERWRRDPQRRSAIALAVVCALALLVSATTAVVIAGVCAVAMHCVFADRRRLRDAAIVVVTVVVVGAVEYLVWLRHLSHGLDVGWTNRGYMLTFKTAHKFVFSLETMGSQLFHWMVGVPTGHPPDPSKLITSAGLIVAAITALLLALVTVPVLIQLIRHRRSLASPLVAPALAVTLAVLLGLFAISPFGGGRTDEVIYPTLLLLFGGFVTKLAHVKTRHMITGLLVASLLATGGLMLIGARNRAQYPTIGLTALYQKLRPHVTSYQFIVVDPWLTFTWGAANITKTSVSFHHEFFDWSQGFHVVSDSPKVIISNQYFFPNAQYGGLSHYGHQLWYVGESGSPSWPTPSPHDQLYVTRNYLALIKLGWVPTTTVLRSTHTIAILMKYDPTRRPFPGAVFPKIAASAPVGAPMPATSSAPTRTS
jgi:hypothetical protein